MTSNGGAARTKKSIGLPTTCVPFLGLEPLSDRLARGCGLSTLCVAGGSDTTTPLPPALADATATPGKKAALRCRGSDNAATTVKTFAIRNPKTNTDLTQSFTHTLAKGTYT